MIVFNLIGVGKNKIIGSKFIYWININTEIKNAIKISL